MKQLELDLDFLIQVLSPFGFSELEQRSQVFQLFGDETPRIRDNVKIIGVIPLRALDNFNVNAYLEIATTYRTSMKDNRVTGSQILIEKRKFYKNLI